MVNSMHERLMSAAAKALVIALCVTAANVSHGAQPRKFLTFSSSLSDDWIKAHGREYVYVWGATDGDGKNRDRARVWATYAPNTQLSSYFPYGRDPARRPPAEWISTHPEWILYQCDGKTMATLFGNPIAPLDISNPAVERWQVKNFAAAEHDSIALDNFATSNVEHACGIQRDGQSVTLYSADKGGQKKFAETKVAWLERVTKAVHAQKKTVTINYQLDLPLDSPLLERIVNATDAILDEEEYPLRSKSRFQQLLGFASMMQSKNKPLYTIYQVKDVTQNNVQSAMAAYLVNAYGKSAIDVTGVQEYGGARAYFGYDRNIGEACGPSKYVDGFYSRKYTGGVAVLRDPASGTAVYKPVLGLVDVDGNAARLAYPLEPAQGLVLYRSSPAACSVVNGKSDG
ncbi:putative glycoside hydrolase [Burkholderia sp. PU8-34]